MPHLSLWYSTPNLMTNIDKRLTNLAESLGYFNQRGPHAGRGGLSALLYGLAVGEMAVVKLVYDAAAYGLILDELRELTATARPDTAELVNALAVAIGRAACLTNRPDPGEEEDE